MWVIAQVKSVDRGLGLECIMVTKGSIEFKKGVGLLFIPLLP